MLRFTTHMYMPGHTIEGVLKKENLHDVSKSELETLMTAYTILNGNDVAKVGQTAKIPILERHAVAKGFIN